MFFVINIHVGGMCNTVFFFSVVAKNKWYASENKKGNMSLFSKKILTGCSVFAVGGYIGLSWTVYSVLQDDITPTRPAGRRAAPSV